MARQTKAPAPRRAKRHSSVNWRRARLIEASAADLDDARGIMPPQLVHRLSLRSIARLQDE